MAQLPLPAGSSVVELSAAAQQPGLLLVLCRDGTLQLWQVANAQCCCSVKADAFAAVGGCCKGRGAAIIVCACGGG